MLKPPYAMIDEIDSLTLWVLYISWQGDPHGLDVEVASAGWIGPRPPSGERVRAKVGGHIGAG